MKTVDELAEEYRDGLMRRGERMNVFDTFLAGYQAAKDRQEYLMNEISILRSRLDTAEKLSQLVNDEEEQ